MLTHSAQMGTGCYFKYVSINRGKSFNEKYLLGGYTLLEKIAAYVPTQMNSNKSKQTQKQDDSGNALHFNLHIQFHLRGFATEFRAFL